MCLVYTYSEIPHPILLKCLGRYSFDMFVQSLFLQSLFENVQLYFGAVCAAELHIVKAEHHWPAKTKWQFLFKERRIAPNWGWKQENAGSILPEEKQKCKSLFCVVWSCSGTVARALWMFDFDLQKWTFFMLKITLCSTLVPNLPNVPKGKPFWGSVKPASLVRWRKLVPDMKSQGHFVTDAG